MNFSYHVCPSGLNSQSNKLMEKSRTLGTNMVFVCYVSTIERSKHSYQFDLLWSWFWSSTHQFSHLCPQKTVQKATIFFPQKHNFLLEKSLICTRCYVCPYFFVKIAAALVWKWLFNCYNFKKLTKNILFDCFGVRFVPCFGKKRNNSE